MGLIGKVIGAGGATALGNAATGLAEVFTPNATKRMEGDQAAYIAAVTAQSAEFTSERDGWFGGFVNGLNRLPRPMLALGTLGLFVYAMADPAGFATRMQGLAFVPEPLWWLLGAIVSFYFGAREAHYFRAQNAGVAVAAAVPASAPLEDGNAALDDWRASHRPA